MNLRGLFQAIRNFLFSKANREFLIFLFFFAVAGIFWLLTTLNQAFEQELRIPVHLTNVPKMAVLTSHEVDTLQVTVSDKGYVLAAYLTGDAQHDIFVDFKNYAQQDGKVAIPANVIQKLVTQRLAASSKLIGIKPSKVTFYFNHGEKKRVPVVWKGIVEPEDMFFLANVVYSPDSVTIYASGDKLDSISTVYTEDLSYHNFRDTLCVKAPLKKMSGVKMVPEEVSISFMTDVLTEESIDGIPIVGINMPAGKVLRTFPSRVSVKFVTGVNNYRKLSAKDFLVVADYNEIVNNPSAKCDIHLRKIPAGLSKVQLETKQVDYLIEERKQ